MHGQVSFEYLVIVGLVIFFLIPLWAHLAAVQSQTQSHLSITYAENAARRIADTADLVHSQGAPAKVTVNIFIPSGIASGNITNNLIHYKVYAGEGITDVVEFARTNITGTLPLKQGTYTFVFESFDTYVLMTTE